MVTANRYFPHFVLDASSGSGLTDLSPCQSKTRSTDSKSHACLVAGDTGRRSSRECRCQGGCPNISIYVTRNVSTGPNVSMGTSYDTADIWYSDKPGTAKRDNKTDVQLNLAMPRRASGDQGATPVQTIWPCLAVQAMCYHNR